MLYHLIKPYARLAINIYCRHIIITNKHLLRSKGPLLLAVNHPNSFLDAVILDTLFDEPIVSLARGDAFSKPMVAKVLRSLNILPVYREREGKEHLHRNYDTFDECIDIFRRGGVVLIFTEALCENEWHLRPLKKGTARMASAAWQQNIPLKILPIGINYNSFRLFGKNIHVNIGDIISRQHITSSIDENGKLLNELTASIEAQLKKLVYEIDSDNKQQQAKVFTTPVSVIKKSLLAIPAIIGAIVHLPLCLPIQKIVEKKAGHLGHYDSIVVGVLLIAYPIYMFLVAAILFITLGKWWAIASVLLLPFFAWSYVQLSQQTDQ